MHPDLTFAVAKTHQHEMRRHAEAARKASGGQARTRVHLTLPEIRFARRVGAIRARIAEAV